MMLADFEFRETIYQSPDIHVMIAMTDSVRTTFINMATA